MSAHPRIATSPVTQSNGEAAAAIVRAIEQVLADADGTGPVITGNLGGTRTTESLGQAVVDALAG